MGVFYYNYSLNSMGPLSRGIGSGEVEPELLAVCPRLLSSLRIRASSVVLGGMRLKAFSKDCLARSRLPRDSKNLAML